MFVCLDQGLIPVLLHESNIKDDGASQIMKNKGVQTHQTLLLKRNQRLFNLI